MVTGNGFPKLLQSPISRGMLGHIEMQHLATTVLQHDEHEQHPQGDRRYGEKVDRDQLAEVVVKKRLPSLTRRPPDSSEHSGDRAL